MSSPAFRCEADLHLCPLVSGVSPHIGGKVRPSSHRSVLICGSPAAANGDLIIEAGASNIIVGGSSTVFFNGHPAARLGDITAHGSPLLPGPGAPTVLIG